MRNSASAGFRKGYGQGQDAERRGIKFQKAGTVIEAPGQLRLSSRKMQQTVVDDFTHVDGSSSQAGESCFLLQAVDGVRPNTTSQLNARRKVVILQMG